MENGKMWEKEIKEMIVMIFSIVAILAIAALVINFGAMILGFFIDLIEFF